MTLLLKLSPNTEFIIQLILVCTIGFLCMLFLHWLYDKISRRHRIKIANENCYERRYADLQKMVNSYDVHKDNFVYLTTQLNLLSRMGHKNEEKTEVLNKAFDRRFARFKEDNKTVPEDEVNEFGADQLDFEECEKRIRLENEASKI